MEYSIDEDDSTSGVCDAVGNRWDMDPSTDELENKGTWTFGLNPASEDSAMRDLEESYEEAE